MLCLVDNIKFKLFLICETINLINCEIIYKLIFILNYYQQINKRVLSITLWKRMKYANNYITEDLYE